MSLYFILGWSGCNWWCGRTCWSFLFWVNQLTHDTTHTNLKLSHNSYVCWCFSTFCFPRKSWHADDNKFNNHNIMARCNFTQHESVSWCFFLYEVVLQLYPAIRNYWLIGTTFSKFRILMMIRFWFVSWILQILYWGRLATQIVYIPI